MTVIRSTLLLCVALVSLPLHAASVVASMNPVALIAAEILAGVAQVETLLPEGASPHDYALRPSDRRLVDQAALVIWVGPETEPYLEKVVTAAGVPDFHWQESDTEHAEHQEGGDTDHDEHDHAALHPWLSPESAEHFAERLAQKAQEIFAPKSDQIAGNLRGFLDRLAAVESDAKGRLEPVKTRGFFVFHDAYQGLVDHFELNQVGYFTLDPSRKPGAKHLAQLREELAQSRVRCVFVEPQYSAALVESITRGLTVRQGELDPLAGGFVPAVGSYHAYYSSLVNELERCLNQG